MDYAEKIAHQLNVRPSQASAAIQLLDEGNTLPFIARYRKEATGSLDEEQLRLLGESLTRLRALDERRASVMETITEQGKMTPELEAQLLAAENLTTLEDLYQPYKKKRRTRATIAREKGLEPLAQLILSQPQSKETAVALALPFVTDEVPTVEDALAGARDIVAETMSDHAEVRQRTRDRALKWGRLTCQKIEDAVDEKRVYEIYYEIEYRVDRLRPYQILAINRGEEEKILRVQVVVEEQDWLLAMRTAFRPNPRSPFAEQLQLAMADSAQRLLLPAIERDVRRELTEKAEEHAIRVFAKNLQGLLNQPPLLGLTILGLDPGYRTGCKVAIIDPTGKSLETGTIYPHPPQKEWQKSLKQLADWVARYQVSLIAIGNGTASRETEQLAAELIKQVNGRSLNYLMVNEAGASVYSASPLARAELPDLDVSLRGAVSIARRVQDPLAELVKIDPQSIGVGMYQHDVNQKQLADSLTGVVETVVNRVGVDVNTASPALLTYVAGIGPKLAEKIVAYRDQNGRFLDRQKLLKVSGLGAKAFEQCAGFLRIREGQDPLDSSAIHPESYAVARAVLQKAKLSLTTPATERELVLQKWQSQHPLTEVAAELKCGVPTLTDILEQLARPGRDPREDLPRPILRSDVLSMEDLQPGMKLKGTVRNVVDFGVFIDIGVKQDGLLHRSQLPPEVSLSVGEVITVEMLKAEPERGRISLGWAAQGEVEF